MWSDERQELKENIINGLKTALLYGAVWAVMMIPVVKMFL